MRTYTSLLCCLLVACAARSSAFVASRHPACLIQSSAAAINTHLHQQSRSTSISLHMIDPSAADIGVASLLLSETEPWVQPTAVALDVFTNFFSLAMLIRVVLSWYPQMNVKELPWSLIVFPTEPLLKAARGSIPPAFGVDITPIVWLGLFTFVHEILLGQQGLLTMKMKYGI